MDSLNNHNVSNGVKSQTNSVTVPDTTTLSATNFGDKRCSISVSTTDSVSGGSAEDGSIGSPGAVSSTSPGKVPKKFITTWRHACDKTKDRTKDLFKRWRTLPETGGELNSGDEINESSTPVSTTNHGWSVHVWATWVKRYPSDEEDNIFDNEADGDNISEGIKFLTTVQKEKLEHFFSHLFDTDRDDLISIQDFESFCERLKRFADWTENSAEFVTLQQVKDGFVEHFILSQRTVDKETINQKPHLQVVSLEEWLGIWGKLLYTAHSWSDFPIWLQVLPRILFQAINTSGSGVVTQDELSMFYSSILGFTGQHLNTLLEKAYKEMTASGEHPLTYSIYRLCFANFLLGRFPNGPGHYIMGHMPKQVTSFPIDYSAMNTPVEELEQYTPDKKTNRHSVIV